MNENGNEVLDQEPVDQDQVQEQDQEDAFADGFDDPGVEGPTDQSEPDGQGHEPQHEPSEDRDGGEEPPAGEGKPGEDEDHKVDTQTEELPKEQTWEVNHLGQRKTLRAQDITPELLQKGMDYDRIHQQYDRTKPVMALISTMAQKAGVSVEEYTNMVRTQALQQSKGLSEEEARREVELEDREAAIKAEEAARQEATQRREAGEAEVQRGIAEFARAFPEIYEQARKNPEVIPDSVWEAVNGGLSLTAAYAQYAVTQAAKETQAAQAQAQTAKQNQRNAQRSTGSMKSAGNDARNTDAFLAGFDE